jgi:hypothetical protein
VQVPHCCWCQSYAPDKAPYINYLEQTPKPASINLQKWFLSPTGSIKPWFYTEGKLADVLIIPSSWGSQLGASTSTNPAFFGAVVGDKEDFSKGSLSLLIFYFVIVLLTFFTLFLLAYFYQKYKKLVPFLVGILLLLLLVYYVVP